MARKGATMQALLQLSQGVQQMGGAYRQNRLDEQKKLEAQKRMELAGNADLRAAEAAKIQQAQEGRAKTQFEQGQAKEQELQKLQSGLKMYDQLEAMKSTPGVRDLKAIKSQRQKMSASGFEPRDAAFKARILAEMNTLQGKPTTSEDILQGQKMSQLGIDKTESQIATEKARQGLLGAQTSQKKRETELLGMPKTQNIKWETKDVGGKLVQVGSDGSVRDLGVSTLKPMDAKTRENYQGNLLKLKLARKQIQDVKDAAKKLEGFEKGVIAGRFPTEAGEAFDAAVDPLRVTLRSMTRTPGEGSMSDRETALALAPTPTRKKWNEAVTGQQITQIENMIDLLESGYQARLNSDQKSVGNINQTAQGEDAEALNWAQSNPDDPRAKQILQRLGR